MGDRRLWSWLFLLIATGSSGAVAFPQEAALPPDLPDFSRVGYHAGEAELPQREVTLNLVDLGGVGDGKTDATKALRAALAEAAKSGGVVGIPPGRWMLAEPLEIRANGVVLKGAGSEKTTLVCPRSLSDILGPKPGWSWSGGMIQLLPPRGKSEKVATVRGKASAGARRLPVRFVEGTDRPAPGEWLELLWYNDRGKDTLLDHLYGGAIPEGRMGKELQEAKAPRVKEWVLIEAVEEGALRIAQGIPIDVRTEWSPTLVRRPHLEEVGVEGITFEFPETIYPGHLKEKGYNAVFIGSAIDCWVRDVRIVHADSGIFLNSSKRVTITGVTLRGKKMHHPLSLSSSSNCLVTRWRIAAPHVHGTTLSWGAHHNVYSKGYGRDLAMDCHRAAPFENLHTAIVIDEPDGKPDPFRSGGSAPRGPHSARRNVYWNIEFRFGSGGDRKGERPVAIRGHGEWPLGIFVGWRGDRPLEFAPIEGLRQRILALNAVPGIPDLHEHQRSTAMARKRSR